MHYKPLLKPAKILGEYRNIFDVIEAHRRFFGITGNTGCAKSLTCPIPLVENEEKVTRNGDDASSRKKRENGWREGIISRYWLLPTRIYSGRHALRR